MKPPYRLLFLPLFLVLPLLSAFEEFTAEQTKSADRAVQWIVRAQNRDGSWGMDSKTPADVSATSLAGLALLSTGCSERACQDC